MEPANAIVIGTSTVQASATLPLLGYDILTPLLGWLFAGATEIGLGGAFSFIGTLWSVIAVFAYIISAVFLGLYVYATVRKGQLEEMQDELLARSEQVYDEHYRTGPKNDRLKDVDAHISSEKPGDWKLAIIEADIILDEGLKKAGYVGNSLGERLRTISPTQMQTLDDAWEAHKVRNKVAHGGEDFVLTKRLAEDTIKQYRRVFEELGLL